MSNITLTVDELQKLQPADILTHEPVRDKFIQIWDTLWGEGKGEAAYERELVYFNHWLKDNAQTAAKATRFSIFTTFIDLAVCGLSVEPGVRALCYLQPRSIAVGKNERGDNIYENRLTLTVSGYGELVMRARAGQIKYADNPVIVYEEDSFSFSDNDGRKSVKYTCNLPHRSRHIVACFMKIVRTDNSVDYAVMFEEDWTRLSDYSARQNRKWNSQARRYEEGAPNALYSSQNGGIDPGFLMAKCIKHAFKTYPKVRIGRGTQMETDTVDQPQDDFYGVDEPAADPQPEPGKPQDFCPPRDDTQGVTIDPGQSEDNDEAW